MNNNTIYISKSTTENQLNGLFESLEHDLRIYNFDFEEGIDRKIIKLFARFIKKR